jgi:hypothetical protein
LHGRCLKDLSDGLNGVVLFVNQGVYNSWKSTGILLILLEIFLECIMKGDFHFKNAEQCAASGVLPQTPSFRMFVG